MSRASSSTPAVRGTATAVVAAIRTGLALRADPAAAPGMQAYMKSTMPFRGVAAPARAALLRTLPELDDPAVAVRAAEELWDGATYREERYLATALARRAPPDPARLPLYRHWIITSAWWDHVDEIAARLVGPLLLAYPDVVRPAMREWARDPDRWLRRTAVVCQLGAKERTDRALLAEAIEANLDDGDFFLRKGIGWALRQYGRVEPGWVRDFVDAHPALSPLSRKEALRHLS
jgi:3-methyladenine DNA glycosylase AlkD